MVRDLTRDAAPILDLLRADLRASVGLDLDARVRWVSPEQQQARDAEFDRLASDPKTTSIGARPAEPWAKPLDEYEGYWALELPHSLSMIHDASEVIDLIQEDVIEELWRAGRSASWPECPKHGGHPLACVTVDRDFVWRCPRDQQISIRLGHLAEDRRS